MTKEKGVRFSVYFHKEQIDFLDQEAEKMGVSRSKYIERKIMPKDLQILEQKKGAPKGVKDDNI